MAMNDVAERQAEMVEQGYFEHMLPFSRSEPCGTGDGFSAHFCTSVRRELRHTVLKVPGCVVDVNCDRQSG